MSKDKLSPDDIQQRQQAKYNEKVIDLTNMYLKVSQLYEFDVVCGSNARISMQIAQEITAAENVDLATIAYMSGVYKGISENLMRNREQRIAQASKKEEEDELARQEQKQNTNRPRKSVKREKA